MGRIADFHREVAAIFFIASGYCILRPHVSPVAQQPYSEGVSNKSMITPGRVTPLYILAILPSFFFLTPMSAIEEPAFEIVKTYENFEIRKYAPYHVAETEVGGDFEEVGDEAFNILAGYIFGGNASSTKIEMTAPVNMAPILAEGETYTTQLSEVSSATGERKYQFQFVMPAEFNLQNLPKPNDSRVHLREVPAKWVAAHRYSGSWSEGKYRKKEAELLQALEKEGLKTVSAPVFARYNAPFVPMFFRRNEVLVELDPSVASRFETDQSTSAAR